MTGSTVVRPLVNQFPNDEVTWEIDEQFLWGNDLLISPALTESDNVPIYLPTGTNWYDYFTGQLRRRFQIG